MQPSRYVLKTLGCKANLYDSQLMEQALQARGWVPAEAGGEDEAALWIVNSCTVTDEADRQSRKTATKGARTAPGAKIVYTGCGAEVEPEKIAATPGVSYVIGNQDKNRLVDLVLREIEREGEGGAETKNATAGRLLGGVSSYAEILSRHPMDREWASPESSFHLPPVQLPGESGRKRGFLKIQEGCDSFCTYCIIPYGRGPSRSLSIPALVDQVRALVADGTNEIVITGTNIGDYGSDWNGGKPALEKLVSAILEETTLSRLRISSLDPVEIGEALRTLMRGNPRLLPHFHVSLQSPHAKILRLMKRKYDAVEVERCLEAIAELPAPKGGAFVGMDVITGFPGESDEDFEWGYAQLERLPWSRLHVFPYSEREGTPATRLKGAVPMHVRLARAQRLRALSLERLKTLHQEVLADSQAHRRPLDRVLFESPTKGPGAGLYVGGYSSNYLRALLPVASLAEAHALRNRVFDVRPTSVVVDSAAGDCAFLVAPANS